MVEIIGILESPIYKEAASLIKKGVASKATVIVLGKCSVDYIGRSESRLTEGERIIIIKEDGAFLVHRPQGHSPVNWQPETSAIEVRETDLGLEITAVRRSPREIVSVFLPSIYFVMAVKLKDKGEFIMYLDEHEIRDLLFEKPELLEEGLTIVEKEKRIQSNLIDLFGYDKQGRPVIIEIKRVTASKDAVLQLYRYVGLYHKYYGVKPRGILVAPQITQAAIESIEKLGLEYKAINIQKLWNLKKNLMKKRSIEGRSLLDYLK